MDELNTMIRELFYVHRRAFLRRDYGVEAMRKANAEVLEACEAAITAVKRVNLAENKYSAVFNEALKLLKD